MTEPTKYRWADYGVLGLSIFLVFCLLFEPYIELPNLVAWSGRLHPLVLHFPIVLLLVAVLLGLTNRPIPKLLLTAGVLSALITAVSGFFLGKDVPIKGELLFWHQWLGGATALIAALWYALERNKLTAALFSKILQVAVLGLIVVTGHYGGMVTHGEGFLAFPAQESRDVIPENPVIYKDIVARILDDKCVSCHNPNKQKGELVMTGFDELVRGGENGDIFVAGNLVESEMIRRLHLPLGDEEHMPPEGKSQLGENEIAILEQWIATGASDTVRLDQLSESEPLVALIKAMMAPDPSEKWAELPKVADTALQAMASDYLSISRIADGSEALGAVLFPPPGYDPKTVLALERVAENIVHLDLSGIPIGEDEIDLISTFANLERLELDRTPIGDSDVRKLSSLNRLSLLKIYDTAITDESLSALKQMSALKSLYLYRTEVSEEGIASLKKERPDLLVDNGIDRATNAFFVANDTVPEN
ncbi:c-type cytochrome domain-containing protein [Pricia sp. S334]|uniref:C-type cytochrome domain-containing protein n=1 Tax=Pricia mediterranea TaxID=3076079 RepID=A0ABU3L4X7_9FLAO|nr:c-type cytochrome domain-containing protein [Pricia sp. S334]MDT7828308.1 c-type cytochrome domain-containing protein [Pricia sp. S334]